MAKIYYAIVEHFNAGASISVEDAYEIPVSDIYNNDHSPSSIRTIVEQAAEDYYFEHDGWEFTWPVTIRLWDEQKYLIGDYEVEMEAEPTFSLTNRFSV